MCQFFFARAVRSRKRERYIIIAENEKKAKKLLMEEKKLEEKQIRHIISFSDAEKGVYNITS